MMTTTMLDLDAVDGSTLMLMPPSSAASISVAVFRYSDSLVGGGAGGELAVESTIP